MIDIKESRGNSSRGQSLSGKRAQGWQRRLAGGIASSSSRPVGTLVWGNSSRRQSLSGKRAQGCRQRWAGGNLFLLQPAGRRRVHNPRVIVVAYIASLGGKRLWGRCEGGWGPSAVQGLRPVPYVGPGVWQGVIFTPPAGSLDQKGRGSSCGRQRPACRPLVGPCEGRWGSLRLASCCLRGELQLILHYSVGWG